MPVEYLLNSLLCMKSTSDMLHFLKWSRVFAAYVLVFLFGVLSCWYYAVIPHRLYIEEMKFLDVQYSTAFSANCLTMPKDVLTKNSHGFVEAQFLHVAKKDPRHPNFRSLKNSMRSFYKKLNLEPSPEVQKILLEDESEASLAERQDRIYAHMRNLKWPWYLPSVD